jgi:hypothetical protein
MPNRTAPVPQAARAHPAPCIGPRGATRRRRSGRRARRTCGTRDEGYTLTHTLAHTHTEHAYIHAPTEGRGGHTGKGGGVAAAGAAARLRAESEPAARRPVRARGAALGKRGRGKQQETTKRTRDAEKERRRDKEGRMGEAGHTQGHGDKDTRGTEKKKTSTRGWRAPFTSSAQQQQQPWAARPRPSPPRRPPFGWTWPRC